jgi:hypothetical protein
MTTAAITTPTAKRTTVTRRRVGAVLSAIAVLFLTFDSVIKVLQLAPAVDATVQLGYPLGSVLAIGIIEAVCLALYLVPRTSVLGAVLFTGYLGGAIATQVRVESPLLSHTLFPIYVATLVWGGLYLREDRLRALLPIRNEDPRS